MAVLERMIAGESVRIVVHEGMHLDELVALFLVEEFGTTEFLNQYAEGGELRLGAEGGPFDEHAREDEARKRGDCTATLVAKALGVDGDLSLRQLLSFTFFSDTGEARSRNRPLPEESFHPFALDQLIKERWRALGDDSARRNGDGLRVIEQSLDDIRLFYLKQKRFSDACEEVKSATVVEVPCADKPFRTVMITSDNQSVGAAARAQLKADLVIQRDSRGRVHVFATDRKLRMHDFVQMLNRREQEVAGAVKVVDWETLRQEGFIPGGRWFYLPHLGQVHNGTESHPDIPATMLTDDDIAECVRVAFNLDYFEPRHEKDCHSGTCNARSEKDCPLYRFGLQRCREIRYRMKNGVK